MEESDRRPVAPYQGGGDAPSSPPPPQPRRVSLDAVVSGLLAAGASDPIGRASRRNMPSLQRVRTFLRLIRGVLLPGHDGPAAPAGCRYRLGETLTQAQALLLDEAVLALAAVAEHPEECAHCRDRAQAIAADFLDALPGVRRLVGSDVEAAFRGDPALTSPDEAILCSPGVAAVASQRLAHVLHRLGLPLVPRMMTEAAHAETGTDIHPGASLGERLFIDHGTGVVIGETAVVGKGVRIYQGVTLGARSFRLDEHGDPVKGLPRHPIIEDEVVIYSGASVLGRITIGRGSVIGGSVWVTRSLPPGTIVTQQRKGQGEGGRREVSGAGEP